MARSSSQRPCSCLKSRRCKGTEVLGAEGNRENHDAEGVSELTTWSDERPLNQTGKLTCIRKSDGVSESEAEFFRKWVGGPSLLGWRPSHARHRHAKRFATRDFAGGPICTFCTPCILRRLPSWVRWDPTCCHCTDFS